MKMVFPILHQYHAVHSSGIVPLARKKLIVIHDPEGGSGHTAAETTGSWFQNQASGGSTQYATDNDSVQQFLDMAAIAWGAPYANTQGIHIEGYGYVHWDRAEWMATADGSLHRTAWLIAYIAKACGIPLRYLSDTQLRNGNRGITSHEQCTRVFPGGSHTDPGKGYPFDYVLSMAKKYAA